VAVPERSTRAGQSRPRCPLVRSAVRASPPTYLGTFWIACLGHPPTVHHTRFNHLGMFSEPCPRRRRVLRARHYSRRTEEAYVAWVRGPAGATTPWSPSSLSTPCPAGGRLPLSAAFSTRLTRQSRSALAPSAPAASPRPCPSPGRHQPGPRRLLSGRARVSR
jgi:hypothetical protein